MCYKLLCSNLTIGLKNGNGSCNQFQYLANSEPFAVSLPNTDFPWGEGKHHSMSVAFSEKIQCLLRCRK